MIPKEIKNLEYSQIFAFLNEVATPRNPSKKKKKSRTQTIPKTPVFLKKETTLKKIPKFKNFQILTLPKAKILPEIRFKFKLNRDRNKHATSCRESKLAARVFESNNYRFDRDRNRTPRSTQLVRIKTRSDRDTFAISN